MKLHELKIREDFADAIITGDKTFELRYNDRGYQKGDHIRFGVWRPVGADSAEKIEHEISTKEYQITYVLNGWGLKNEFVVLAIKEVKCDAAPASEPTARKEAAPKRRKVDHGKIRALKNAGWSNKDIADEMNMTPAAVANSLSTHKELIKED